ncbi:hypothetical protein PPL_00148 [Heterostelium album PN500]|uniref:RRM domain-containing protein n=1 Tax=Heterostelium pallidum (strain ATCC 26659 / Pp 5 / PN500) TaxID=670386 RepID=D3AVN3_HETP5|nr:hypothetical protein PPL_00148 [Heterostelium album PN500]EFA86356.1 hypothetical protein PPL_00148 [Heterostelium album PN500]|eukprot:XP_020438461.1 hypothetical protein PPL_00148 [Heterostelium album PN500]
MNTQSQITSSIPSSSSSSSSSGSTSSPISHTLNSQFATNTQVTTPTKQNPAAAAQPTQPPINSNPNYRQPQLKIAEKKDVPVARAEVIKFMSPTAASSLFISNLPNSVSISDMLTLLNPFGLVFDIISKDGNFLIKYYSAIAAQNAYNSLYGQLVHGYPMRIAFSKQAKTFELRYEQSAELINYYVGFNQWSTEIIGTHFQQSVVVDPMSMYGEEVDESIKQEEQQLPSLTILECVATIRMVLKDGRSITVDGSSQIDSMLNNPDYHNHPKKAAITNARRVAFSKLAIVRIDGQSVLHILDQSIEEQWSQHDKQQQQQQQQQIDNQAYLNSF